MTLFTDHQISQYLDRPDYRSGTKPTLDHLTTIPFGIQVPDSYQNFLYRQEE